MFSCPVLLPTVGSLRQVSSYPVRTSYPVNADRSLAPCRTASHGALQTPRKKPHQIAETYISIPYIYGIEKENCYYRDTSFIIVKF